MTRDHKERRHGSSTSGLRLEDDEHGLVLEDRRKQHERRLENMDAGERQTLLSEMPGVDTEKPK